MIVTKFEISKEELGLLPLEVFEGPVVVVDNQEAFDEMMMELSKETVIGFDTETKPVFSKGKHNKVALLQIATSVKCYLVRLNKLGFPDALMRMFMNTNLLKIGLSIKDDFLMLRGRNGDFEASGFVELQTFVKAYGIADNSLQKIYALIFLKRISKSQRLSNWEAEELTINQKSYAALDAYACRKIYLELKQNYTTIC